MADRIRRIDYYYAAVPDKPGEASRILWVNAPGLRKAAKTLGV